MTVAPSVIKLRKKQQRTNKRKGDLAPNPEMWEALGEGKLLTKILTDFYSLVFKDDELAHFFKDSTEKRAREKQYLFMNAILTGEKVYFGERPRNAHSWMIISDELFDYREQLMEDVIRKHGLDEIYIKQWRAIDEIYRKQIVKSKPINKQIGGVELPAEGYATEILEVAGICDECECEVDVGSEVSYHLRTGKVFCKNCMPEEA